MARAIRILGTRLYYPFWENAVDTDEKFTQQMDAVCREIGTRGQPTASSPSAPVSVAATASTTSMSTAQVPHEDVPPASLSATSAARSPSAATRRKGPATPAAKTAVARRAASSAPADEPVATTGVVSNRGIGPLLDGKGAAEATAATSAMVVQILEQQQQVPINQSAVYRLSCPSHAHGHPAAPTVSTYITCASSLSSI